MFRTRAFNFDCINYRVDVCRELTLRINTFACCLHKHKHTHSHQNSQASFTHTVQ